MSSASGTSAQGSPATVPDPLLSVHNARFDPAVDASGDPEFAGIGGESLPSTMGDAPGHVDYVFVQRNQAADTGWQDELTAAGLEIIGVTQANAVLARCAHPCPDATALPDVRWMGPARPGYKISPSLSASTDRAYANHGSALDPEYWLVASMHRGELAGAYVGSLTTTLACESEVLAVDSTWDPTGHALGTLRVRVDETCLMTARDFLARMEAVEYVSLEAPAQFLLSDSCWATQTALPPGPGLVYDFDVQAKLFANGVTGRGEIIGIADSTLENDDCHFRHGPLLGDVTLVPTVETPPPLPHVAPSPSYRPENKVVAQYRVGTADPIYEANDHGTRVASAALGDDHAFLAARAGVEIDDPARDERPGTTATDATILVDHRQEHDGTAPGARLIFQSLTELPGDAGTLTVADLTAQAYLTTPGARTTSYSWSPAATAGGEYSDACRRLDHLLWSTRDVLPAIACGNSGLEARPSLVDLAHAKNVLAVGALDPIVNGVLPSTLMTNPISGSGCGGGYSAYGPGSPNRVKPDLVASGSLVGVPATPGTPELGDGTAPDECAQTAIECSGTSIAAPVAAGLAALVRQYFSDGYHPSGAANPGASFNPTSALVKAILINGTRSLNGVGTGDDSAETALRPSFGQGWGWPVVDDVLYFPGDPVNPGERSRLLVLNDVPNGYRAGQAVSDHRLEVVEDLKPSVRTGDIHAYPIVVRQGEPIHVTLAWTDPMSLPANPYGPRVVTNDLDLEVIDGDGRVWRPRPGETADVPPRCTIALSNRWWKNGYSDLLTTTCPAGCCTNPSDLEQLEPQHPYPGFCDFSGRDSANNVENVFIDAGDITANGNYIVRVIGYEVRGAGIGCKPVLPSYVLGDPPAGLGDGSDEHDIACDTEQGYALVASGRVAASKPQLHFDRATYRCDGTGSLVVTVTVVDADAVAPVEVALTTDVGDCEVVSLAQVGTESVYEGTVIVQDVADAPTLVPSCVGPGDGILLVGPGGSIVGTHESASARARVICREVQVDDVVVNEPCPENVGPAMLNRNDISDVTFTITNTMNVRLAEAWYRVTPTRSDVVVLGGGGVLLTVWPPPAPTLSGHFVAYLRDDGLPCESAPARFELDVFAGGGYHQRAFIDVPVDCANVGVIPESALPGEVDPVSVRVTKSGTTDVAVAFASAPGAIRYNVWRGTIGALRHAAYDHYAKIGIGACNATDNPVILADDAAEANPTDFYYLVSGETTCPLSGAPAGAALAIHGPTGNADRDNGLLASIPPTLDERRPLGWEDPPAGCEP